ncbi:hypothetical protein LguiB_035313 [Lonicera macranthoides]
MLSSLRRATPHFTHPFPGHILVEHHAETEYHCYACKTDGGGTSFQCNSCDYQMHDYCTMCPSALSSFMHPHPLTLAVTQSHRICHLCNDEVDGLFFWCQYCDDFNIHPLCTLMPRSLCHVLHQVHPLALQASEPGWCTVCGGICHSWRYRCGHCNFDIHMDCVSVPCGPGQTTQTNSSPALTQPTQERRLPPWAGYGYNYGVPSGFSTHNVHNCHAPTPYYGDSGCGYNQYNNHHQYQVPPSYGDNGCAQYYNLIQLPQNGMYNCGNNLQQQGQGSSGGTTINGGYKRKKIFILSFGDMILSFVFLRLLYPDFFTHGGFQRRRDGGGPVVRKSWAAELGSIRSQFKVTKAGSENQGNVRVNGSSTSNYAPINSRDVRKNLIEGY